MPLWCLKTFPDGSFPRGFESHSLQPFFGAGDGGGGVWDFLGGGVVGACVGDESADFDWKWMDGVPRLGLGSWRRRANNGKGPWTLRGLFVA